MSLRPLFLAAAAALALCTHPAAAQSSGCDWREGSLNLAYPETNARYYTAALPQRPPAGSRIRIEGLYPNTRYFSFQTYTGTYLPIDTLADHQVQPDAGSAATWVDRTVSAPDVAPGGRYTVYVEYTRFPEIRKANTLYTDAGRTSTRRHLLVHRTYLEDGPIVLPRIVLETPDGDRPLDSGTGNACAETAPFQLSLLSGLNLLNLSLGSLFPTASQAVDWEVYYETSPTNEGFGLNQDARYMSADVDAGGGVILIRGRAPTVREQSGATPELPDVRYWSICQNDRTTTLVTACVNDREVAVDEAGFFNVVVADAGVVRLPDGAGFARLPFGPSLRGFLIYRQLLAGTDFPGAIGRVDRGIAAADVIGDYAPVSVICPVSRFQRRIDAGDSPAAVYAACAAGR